MKIEVENIKCGGCAATIKSKLEALEGVNSAMVDIESGIVEVTGEAAQDVAIAELARLGYPEVGSVEGLEKVSKQARSMVSCAVGKLKDD